MFNPYICYGGAYIKELEQKYLEATMELFEEILTSKTNITSMRVIGLLLECHENATIGLEFLLDMVEEYLDK